MFQQDLCKCQFLKNQSNSVPVVAVLKKSPTVGGIKNQNGYRKNPLCLGRLFVSQAVKVLFIPLQTTTDLGPAPVQPVAGNEVSVNTSNSSSRPKQHYLGSGLDTGSFGNLLLAQVQKSESPGFGSLVDTYMIVFLMLL